MRQTTPVCDQVSRAWWVVSVRCILRHRGSLRSTYEERVTLWYATDITEAVTLAEAEARDYADAVEAEYTELAGQTTLLYRTIACGAATQKSRSRPTMSAGTCRPMGPPKAAAQVIAAVAGTGRVGGSRTGRVDPDHPVTATVAAMTG